MTHKNPDAVDVLDEIIAALREGRTFCLSGHQNPDADVVGSQLALASLIRRLDPKKKIDILNCGHPPRSVSFLPGFGAVKSVTQVDGVYDVVVVHECSGADRMGNIIDFKSQAKKVINVDHHLHNPYFGDINFVEPTTSSTSELVFKIYERMKMTPTKDEATCMYAGMVADTGWFRYSNTNPQTHRIAGALLAAGVPSSTLAEKMYMGKSFPAMKLVASCLSRIKYYYDNRVALLTLPEALFREVGAEPDDTDEIVNLGLQADAVVASILLKEKALPPTVKVSLRSKGNYDINKVARRFGGGGHLNASGCSLPTTMEEAERQLIKEIASIF